MKFTFYTDPGHGWLEVPRVELIRLGIADKISSYSYESSDGATVYLEEDDDAGKFIEAFKAAGGTVELAENNSPRSDSPVRSLPHYTHR